MGRQLLHTDNGDYSLIFTAKKPVFFGLVPRQSESILLVNGAMFALNVVAAFR